MSYPLATVSIVRPQKLLQRLASGSVSNVSFEDMCALVEAFGFELKRVSGSHHIFVHPNVTELVNLQEVDGSSQAVSDPSGAEAGGAVLSDPGGGSVNDYHINVFYSEEDGGYIADIPDLDSCSAFGETPEKAVAAVDEAKQAWLAAARDEGRPIPPPRYRPAISR